MTESSENASVPVINTMYLFKDFFSHLSIYLTAFLISTSLFYCRNLALSSSFYHKCRSLAFYIKSPQEIQRLTLRSVRHLSTPTKMMEMRVSLCIIFLFSLLAPLLAEFFSDEYSASLENILPTMTRPMNTSRTFYGIMFDAGSTGTRIHVYTFIQKSSAKIPSLNNEIFKSVKPGLSAYADNPAMGGETVRALLETAKETVPPRYWSKTPVVLKATAGLRLLPEYKAEALLQEVQGVFDESPFYVPNDSVSIMNGTNEGILAWITVNFLTGNFYGKNFKTYGTLDLGGGSTQITFMPKSKKSLLLAPKDHTATFEMFNRTYQLYTHSYLGCGLMAARVATMGANEWDAPYNVYTSSCLPKKFKGEWSFGRVTYRVSGNPDGYAGYKLCYQEVINVVRGVINQPFVLRGTTFYAFSYYFDRAVDSGLIDGQRGGIVEVRDFKKKAKEVCNNMTKYRPISPFLCMDMTYITALLKEGFGFKEHTVLHLTKKVNNVETSWALGAAFHLLQSLKSM
ncbi:ectonucleoside triphosphate diphosphohydrolase 5 isoform X1 [Polypterus senegalus]|uniref:ectonucleoside triphosphate diphosphohydrolase 5 isoform X1 n=2 Tax=Polypterus senegalus TaxID=55291 RepID=UPI001962C3D9|nr:ectonucleoside triphosphate diphosphohydrolase 5 isoform X1 [Polypterus senegalus]